VGTHTFEVSLIGYPKQTVSYAVQSGSNVFEYTLKGGKGSLRIMISPPDAKADVTVDGKPILQQHWNDCEVDPGDHTIEVVAPGFEPALRQVTAEAGKPEVVGVTLIPGSGRGYRPSAATPSSRSRGTKSDHKVSTEHRFDYRPGRENQSMGIGRGNYQ